MNKIDWDNYVWSAEELVAILAVRLIEMNMEPKCENCGCGASRNKCAYDLGGGCPRHEQHDLQQFEETIRLIEKRAGLGQKWGWRQNYPLDEIHPFSEDQKALMHDLYDIVKKGGKHETRKMDDRYRYLADINVVYYSSQSDKWQVTFTPRGKALAEKWFEKTP